ncbi:MAG: T9SS type A sorting domain-containing protein [Bacteroidota bacterium]
MKLIYTVFTAFLMFGCSIGFSQTLPYTFSSFTETYEELEGATALTNGIWDDPEFAIPLGFDFAFLGDTASTIYQVGLGSVLSLNPNGYYAVTDFLFAYGSDLIDRGYNDGTSLSTISYKIEGNFGSRICKVEWKNAGFYNELFDYLPSNNFVNLQLWLYEGSNDIEVRFGPNDITGDTLVHDFSGKPMIGMMENLSLSAYSYDAFWYLSGPAQGPKVALSTAFGDLETLEGLMDDPADGTVYQFSTGITSSEERLDLGQHIKVYPNLTAGDVWVEVDENINEEGEVLVVNSIGQIVDRQPMQTGTQQIQLGNFSAGQYFINIQTENGFYSGKIFKK